MLHSTAVACAAQQQSGVQQNFFAARRAHPADALANTRLRWPILKTNTRLLMSSYQASTGHPVVDTAVTLALHHQISHT
jgi:hypothetical protein